MVDQQDFDAAEAQELRDKLWVATQRLSVGFVVFLAGLLLGLLKPDTIAPAFRPLGIQGPAGALKEEVDQLKEKNEGLVKERDTLRSQAALIERDKKEIEMKLNEAEAKAAVCAGGA